MNRPFDAGLRRNDAAAVITIKDIRGIAGMREAADFQKRLAGWEDHTFPVVQMLAHVDLGSLLVGAFDGETLVGFVYALPGTWEGRQVLHSHMLIVEPAYRNLDIGYRLKLAQREQAIAQGVDIISWTYDPLQSVNAHLNVGKLGVDVEGYRIDYLGAETSSSFHRHIGTDRLWVAWYLNSERVRQRLETARDETGRALESTEAPFLVRQGRDGKPERGMPVSRSSGREAWIEIPADIGRWQREDPAVARAWREETRRAFGEALAAGYRVEDFHHGSRGGASHSAYELRRDTLPGIRGTGSGGVA